MSNDGDPRFEGAEGAGYIHPPDEMDDDTKKNGLYCFLDISRPCGSDCMAYTTHTVQPKNTELGEQGRNCSMLVNIERIGIHSVILASMLARKDKVDKTVAADAARAAQALPPNPLGGG